MHAQACTFAGTTAAIGRHLANASSAPIRKKRTYCSMTRYLHTAQSKQASPTQCRASLNKRPGTPSRAPIQSPYAKLKKPTVRAPLGREGKWALMTANTTNWKGAKRLIRALGLPSNPSKPTFIVIQEHRNADPEVCKQAEDWASGYGYNLSLAPAATTGKGKLQTSGGVAVGAQKHIGITIDLPFQQQFAAYKGRIHAVICNCLFKLGVLLVGT